MDRNPIPPSYPVGSVQVSRAERVDAAELAVRYTREFNAAMIFGAPGDAYGTIAKATASAALAASDALLHTDEAVERAAEDLADSDGEHWHWCGSAVKERYRITVRTVITALLEGADSSVE